jgi:Spy/CpxP family protein refolding chaperone
MKMKAGIAVRLGLAIAGVVMAGSAMAQGPGGGQGAGPGFGTHRPPIERAFGAQGDHGRWWNNPRMVERLKLTDEQRKAFDGILLAHREKLIDLRAGLEKAELSMEPLMRADQPNEGQILSQIDKVAQARAELEKANARFLLAIRSKLTPEQWKQLQADREQRGHERGGQGREGWKPGGRGPGGQEPGQFHQPAPPPQPPAEGGAGPQSRVDEDAAPDFFGGPEAGEEPLR